MRDRYVAEMTLDLGERIYIRSIVKPQCDKEVPFKIRNARFELIARSGIEAEGDCSIQEHEISAFIAPMQKGTYTLRYIYEIADETWVDVMKIQVY